MRPLILLNPGPVNVSPGVRAALQAGDACHREPEFAAVIASIRRRLASCFGGPAFAAVALTGSGTAAVEAMVSSGIGEGRLLVINNGVYGQRIIDMATTYRIPVVEVRSSWTEPLALSPVEAALRAHSDVEAIAVVHHETTAGLLNPVAALGALARRHGKRLLVDSVSGLAGDDIDLERDGVDLCAGTANKCIQGVAGISFVMLRRALLPTLSAYRPRSLYLHLPAHFAAQENGTLLFTMAVQTAYACDQALAELEDETVAGRITRYRGAAQFLRAGFAVLGLEFVVPAGSRSNSLTALRLPPGVDYAALHRGLKERGFVIYAGQGALQSATFRVANMGHLTTADFAAFLEALGDIMRHTTDAGQP